MAYNRHQEGKDINEARDDGVAVGSAGPSANHLHLAPDITAATPVPHHSVLAGCPSCRPTIIASKHIAEGTEDTSVAENNVAYFSLYKLLAYLTTFRLKNSYVIIIMLSL